MCHRVRCIFGSCRAAHARDLQSWMLSTSLKLVLISRSIETWYRLVSFTTVPRRLTMKLGSIFSFIFLAASTPLSGEDDAPEIVSLFNFPVFLVQFPAVSWSSMTMTGSFDNDDDVDDGWRAVSLLTTMTPELELDILQSIKT